MTLARCFKGLLLLFFFFLNIKVPCSGFSSFLEAAHALSCLRVLASAVCPPPAVPPPPRRRLPAPQVPARTTLPRGAACVPTPNILLLACGVCDLATPLSPLFRESVGHSPALAGPSHAPVVSCGSMLEGELAARWFRMAPAWRTWLSASWPLILQPASPGSFRRWRLQTRERKPLSPSRPSSELAQHDCHDILLAEPSLEASRVPSLSTLSLTVPATGEGLRQYLRDGWTGGGMMDGCSRT